MAKYQITYSTRSGLEGSKTDPKTEIVEADFYNTFGGWIDFFRNKTDIVLRVKESNVDRVEMVDGTKP